MLPLLLTLLLSSPLPATPPPELQRCTVRCIETQEYNWYGWLCWYREARTCLRTQWVCIEGPDVICRNSVEPLGDWPAMPVPPAPAPKSDD